MERKNVGISVCFSKISYCASPQKSIPCFKQSFYFVQLLIQIFTGLCPVQMKMCKEQNNRFVSSRNATSTYTVILGFFRVIDAKLIHVFFFLSSIKE